MPTAAEVPPIDVLMTQDSPAPGNPLGVRGAGEGGVSAAGAVLASAVRDALGLAGSVGRLPLTPARVQELATAEAADDHGQPKHGQPKHGHGTGAPGPGLREQDRHGGGAHPGADHHRGAGRG